MLVTKQPIFKRFWYPVIPTSELSGEPKAFELLGEPIVLWLDSEGKPAAVEDRCSHRTAKLSIGKIVGGNICCAYHGWTFNSSGTCVSVPQQQNGAISANYKVKAYRTRERYGYVWVCLGEPLAEIPDIPEAADSNYRQIHEFYERWNCAGLRVMENELDMAHPSFVHTATFGSEAHLAPDVMEFEETEWELHYRSILGVANPTQQQQNLKIEQQETVRTIDGIWFMPFTVKLRIVYPNGLVHIIVNTMTPINDSASQMVQFCLRNDTEADAKTSDIIAFYRAVTLEDKRILETTDCDVPLDITQEQHMLTDKPGIIIRRKIAALLKAHGEVEQTQVSSH
ncbi:aromatic ring-hydroxylating dioxygenase subunit alpha [Microcoleus sp. D3_18a_C4]|uniref:aromatic ring-hydroxylating dioxygenase subunit alpha n=1 Tax=Microcoleus sp. D3_18a_C4 TaxID=3055332 RepID=UPI002FD55704